MKYKKLLLIGGGGHCKSVIDTMKQLGGVELAIIDMPKKLGCRTLDIPVIGCDDDLQQLFIDGYKHAFVSLGSIGNTSSRIKLFNQLIEIGYELPTIVDQSATISPNAVIGKGVYIGKRAVVNVDAIIGDAVIINSGAIIEHDCVLSDFVHVAPGAVLCGDVQVGKNSHIGANSVVKQDVSIGANTIIGIGSVVTRDISEGVIAYGISCKEMKTNESIHHS